jgi:hypothetical protein
MRRLSVGFVCALLKKKKKDNKPNLKSLKPAQSHLEWLTSRVKSRDLTQLDLTRVGFCESIFWVQVASCSNIRLPSNAEPPRGRFLAESMSRVCQRPLRDSILNELMGFESAGEKLSGCSSVESSI